MVAEDQGRPAAPTTTWSLELAACSTSQLAWIRRRSAPSRSSCASARRSWPSASAARTTPTGRRCSRRSCRAGRSPTSSSEMSYYIDVGEQDKALAEQIVAGPGGARRRSTRSVDDDAGRDRRAARRRRPPRRSSSTRASRSSRPPRPSCAASRRRGPARLAIQRAAYAKVAANKTNAAKALAAAAKAPKAASPGRSATSSPQQYDQGNIPSQYNGTLTLADGRARSPRTSAAPGSRGSRRSAAAPTSTRASTSSPRTAPPVRASGDGDGRLLRLELRRRRRPGLDRDHRPQPVARDLVRPHDRRTARSHTGGSVSRPAR